MEQTADDQASAKVWLNFDQAALDAAYDQSLNAANFALLGQRMTRSSVDMRRRIGEPQIFAYGPELRHKLHFYPAKQADAPIHIHVHGGAWRRKPALDMVFPAGSFVTRGVSFAVFDFISVDETGGDLMPMLLDVCTCLAWLARHARQLGGDPDKLFISGFSSGAHLAGAALLCDWTRYGLPGNPIKAAILASGMYDLHPVRLSSRSRYVTFTDEVVDCLSPIRHVDNYNIPLTLIYGDCESPEFQRQTCDFAAALKAADKTVDLLVLEGYNHLEVMESLGNPFGPFGRLAIEQIDDTLQTNFAVV